MFFKKKKTSQSYIYLRLEDGEVVPVHPEDVNEDEKIFFRQERKIPFQTVVEPSVAEQILNVETTDKETPTRDIPWETIRNVILILIVLLLIFYSARIIIGFVQASIDQQEAIQSETHVINPTATLVDVIKQKVQTTPSNTTEIPPPAANTQILLDNWLAEHIAMMNHIRAITEQYYFQEIPTTRYTLLLTTAFEDIQHIHARYTDESISLSPQLHENYLDQKQILETTISRLFYAQPYELYDIFNTHVEQFNALAQEVGQ